MDQLQLDLAAVTVSFQGGGRVEEDVRWAAVSGDSLGAAHPWRTFRWYKGQQHYSGTYWASTNLDHVIYESRLELARLLYADFDGAVSLRQLEVAGQRAGVLPWRRSRAGRRRESVE